MALPNGRATARALSEPGDEHSLPTLRAGVLRMPSPRRANRADWAQLARFCVVGGSGYLVNLTIFWLLVERAGAHRIVGAVVAFCGAWLSNFLLNKFWTFRSHELSAIQQAWRYLTASLGGLALNLVVLELLVTSGLREVPAQAIAIAAVTPVNFLLNRRWSFR